LPLLSARHVCSFVPARIPRKRRLQMLAVALWSVGIILATVMFLLLWSVPRPFAVVALGSSCAVQLLSAAVALLGYVSDLGFMDRQESRARWTDESVVPLHQVLDVLCGLLPCFVRALSFHQIP
jgi:2-acylglycerol O-acyltransferase 2